MSVPQLKDSTGRPKVGYSGEIYVNSDTATADTARRFEVTHKWLKDVVLQVTTYDQLLGDSSDQTYPVAVGETLGFTMVDIATLYFKNTTAGENGVVHIFGVED